MNLIEFIDLSVKFQIHIRHNGMTCELFNNNNGLKSRRMCMFGEGEGEGECRLIMEKNSFR